MGGISAPFERSNSGASRRRERQASRKRDRTPEQEARMALLRKRWATMQARALHGDPAQLVDTPAPKESASGLTLRPYQEATVIAATEPKDGVWRRLLVLATGAGKTVIAAEIIRRLIQPGQRALFLAHRDELLSQAKSEIEGYVPGVHVEIEKAENRAARAGLLFDEERRHVVVGSVA
jgi:superfamily II DNA or RNA helicase